ncbi:MAG: hypothetical protein OZ921_05725, partial [Sorangiineae bacterium]|nr:hypothetical protein [Sorangiineae bacterium]
MAGDSKQGGGPGGSSTSARLPAGVSLDDAEQASSRYRPIWEADGDDDAPHASTAAAKPPLQHKQTIIGMGAVKLPEPDASEPAKPDARATTQASPSKDEPRPRTSTAAGPSAGVKAKQTLVGMSSPLATADTEEFPRAVAPSTSETPKAAPSPDPSAGEAKTGEAKTGEAKTDDAKTDDAKTDDAKTDDAKTDDAKTDDAKTD